MNNRRRTKPLPWIPAAFLSLLVLPTALLAQDIRSLDNRVQSASVSERLTAMQGRSTGPTALGQDSSGHEQRITHNPLADDFDFYDQSNAPARTIESNHYRQSASSTHTRGADGGFPEWMPGGTFPWFIGGYSAPSTARPPGVSTRAPRCDYLGRSDPWIIPGTAARYLGCEVRNMNTGSKERHHFDHCQIDDMAHNARPPYSKSFMPSTSGIRGWSPRSNRSLCPAPTWSVGAFSGGSWSGSSNGCGGTFTQTKTETRSATCITNGASPDSYCTQNGRPKPATSQTLTRTVNEPSCPSWTVGNWGGWQGSSACGTGQYQQTRSRSVSCPTGNCAGPQPSSSQSQMVNKPACPVVEDPPVGNTCTPGRQRMEKIGQACWGQDLIVTYGIYTCNATGTGWSRTGTHRGAEQHSTSSPCANGK